MPQYNAVLVEALLKVPELLPAVLLAWKTRGMGVRVLRLISKEIGRAAMQAVRCCSLQIGQGAQPNPRQSLHALSAATNLEELNVSLQFTYGGWKMLEGNLHHTLGKTHIWHRSQSWQYH